MKTKTKKIQAAAPATPKSLAFVSEFQISAAGDGQENKSPSFTMNAYNGGLMRLAGWFYPVVVNLAGMQILSQRLPVRMQHDPNKGVGHTTKIKKSKSELTCEGLISRDTVWAADVINSSKNGFPWQVSIGAVPDEIIFIAEKQKVKCNGQTFDGPCYHVNQSTLSEVSFVDLGADTSTSAAVAAQNENNNLQENQIMRLAQLRLLAQKFTGRLTQDIINREILAAAEDTSITDEAFTARLEELVNKPAVQASATVIPPTPVDAAAITAAAVAAESLRVQTIRAHATDLGIAADKIDSWCKDTTISIEAAHRKMFDERQALHVNNVINAPAINLPTGGPTIWKVLQAAALLGCRYDEGKVVKEFGEQTVQAAHTKYRGRMGLQQLIMECAFANNFSQERYFRGNEMRFVQAAFSGGDISGILSNTASKYMVDAFNAVEQVWRKIAKIRSVSDFKTVTGYRMTGDLKFEKVGPSGELKHGKIGEESYTNKADTYGKLFTVTRTDIINDDMGALTQIPTMLGRGSALKLNEVFWALFQLTGTFYTTARLNLNAGKPLGIDNLSAIVTIFKDMLDADNNPIAVQPKYLVVGNALEVLANQIYKDMNVTADREWTKKPSGNGHQGKYEPVVSTYVGKTGFNGTAATDWYLHADPNDLASIVVSFLNGQETPIVESANAQIGTLGIDMQGYHDWGVDRADYRGVQKCTA